jgi:hypothetical protein
VWGVRGVGMDGMEYGRVCILWVVNGTITGFLR